MLTCPSNYEQWYLVRPNELLSSPSSSWFGTRWMHSTTALHAHITPGSWAMGTLVAAVQRRSLTPSPWLSSYPVLSQMNPVGVLILCFTYFNFTFLSKHNSSSGLFRLGFDYDSVLRVLYAQWKTSLCSSFQPPLSKCRPDYFINLSISATSILRVKILSVLAKSSDTHFNILRIYPSRNIVFV
jgi:hypothetical protein